MPDWEKYHKGNWENYWKDYWKESAKSNWKGQEKKYREMGKIMNKMGETQFKTAELIIQLAGKKEGEDYEKEIDNLDNMIKNLRETIDRKRRELK
jgi:vacuolar-type H+-ATPase catalytic subunit A/Vma1